VDHRSVLITGASTGIGRSCALRLDRKGWRVFAGVRREPDAVALRESASAGLTTLSLDVSDEASIADAAAVMQCELGSAGLQGLVNNAGISVQGPLEYLKPDALRHQFEVNLVGQLIITQSLLDLIRTGRGRIVMMSSISGRAVSWPFLAPYSASKRALEAVGEALHYELIREGIHVSIVEPGSVATPIWSKGDAAIDAVIEAMPSEGRRRYSDAIRRAQALATQAGRRGIPPDRVAATVERALTSARPKLRYLVGSDAHISVRMDRLLPQRLKDALVRRRL
jgi:NAD(P)-dependent dehydrogenase (short-subunit alcohol dehydrogenase family)